MKQFVIEDIVAHLIELRVKYGGVKLAAAVLDITPQEMSDFCNKRRPPTTKVIDKLGLVKVYVRKRELH